MRKDRCLTQAVMINGQDKMTYTTVQYYSYNLSTLSKGIPAIMKIEPQLLLGMITTKRNIQKYTELIEYTPFYHCSRNLLEAMLSNNNQQTHNHQSFPFGNWVTFLPIVLHFPSYTKYQLFRNLIVYHLQTMYFWCS